MPFAVLPLLIKILNFGSITAMLSVPLDGLKIYWFIINKFTRVGYVLVNSFRARPVRPCRNWAHLRPEAAPQSIPLSFFNWSIHDYRMLTLHFSICLTAFPASRPHALRPLPNGCWVRANNFYLHLHTRLQTPPHTSLLSHFAQNNNSHVYWLIPPTFLYLQKQILFLLLQLPS